METNTNEEMMSVDDVVATLGMSRARFYQLGLHLIIRRRKREGRWYYDAEAVKAVASGEIPPTFPVRDALAILTQ